MSALVSTNERSTVVVTIAFFDEDQVATTPSAATYRLHNRKDGRVILAPTAIGSLSTTNELVITPAQNALVSPGAAVEEHVCTVIFTYGSGRQGTAECAWLVKGLAGVV